MFCYKNKIEAYTKVDIYCHETNNASNFPLFFTISSTIVSFSMITVKQFTGLNYPQNPLAIDCIRYIPRITIGHGIYDIARCQIIITRER